MACVKNNATYLKNNQKEPKTLQKLLENRALFGYLFELRKIDNKNLDVCLV